MLLVSAILVSTATYAWFSMNTQVTATGMQVKAQAEGGIVISNEAKSTWTASATASHASVTELIPTSTKSLSVWYHNSSDDAASAKANQAAGTYSSISKTAKNLTETDGVGIWQLFSKTTVTSSTFDSLKASLYKIVANVYTKVEDSETFDDTIDYYVTGETSNIYLLNKFYIKSSAAEDMTSTTLYINEVTVSGTGSSAALDKSLRVAIKVGGTVYIFAPITDGATAYNVCGTASTDNTGSVSAIAAGTKNTSTAVTTIPGNGTDAPVEAEIYMYFEGEDPECKSINIMSTLDTLQVTIRFGTTTID